MTMTISEQACKVGDALSSLQLRINAAKHYDVNPNPLTTDGFKAKLAEIDAVKERWFANQTEEDANKLEALCNEARLLLTALPMPVARSIVQLDPQTRELFSRGPVVDPYKLDDLFKEGLESRRATKSLVTFKKPLVGVEYMQRALNGIRWEMKLNNEILNDRRRFNNASLRMKVRLRRYEKMLAAEQNKYSI